MRNNRLLIFIIMIFNCYNSFSQESYHSADCFLDSIPKDSVRPIRTVTLRRLKHELNEINKKIFDTLSTSGFIETIFLFNTIQEYKLSGKFRCVDTFEQKFYSNFIREDWQKDFSLCFYHMHYYILHYDLFIYMPGMIHRRQDFYAIRNYKYVPDYKFEGSR